MTTLLSRQAAFPTSHDGGLLPRRDSDTLVAAPRLSVIVPTYCVRERGERDGGVHADLPYMFRPRRLGASKLDGLVVADFAGLWLAKLKGNRVSPRFFLFALVGASGLFVHLAVLRSTFVLPGITFYLAQFMAALVAMTTNFLQNNTLTFRDRRLTGLDALKGLGVFYLVCSVGIAELIYLRDTTWWLAGIAGALIAVAFNDSASAMLTWRR